MNTNPRTVWQHRTTTGHIFHVALPDPSRIPKELPLVKAALVNFEEKRNTYTFAFAARNGLDQALHRAREADEMTTRARLADDPTAALDSLSGDFGNGAEPFRASTNTVEIESRLRDAQLIVDAAYENLKGAYWRLAAEFQANQREWGVIARRTIAKSVDGLLEASIKIERLYADLVDGLGVLEAFPQNSHREDPFPVLGDSAPAVQIAVIQETLGEAIVGIRTRSDELAVWLDGEGGEAA